MVNGSHVLPSGGHSLPRLELSVAITLELELTSPLLLPSLCQGYLRAAKCYLMLGNPGLSTDYYGKVLEAEPRNRQALEELEAVEKVQWFLDLASREMEKQDYRAVSQWGLEEGRKYMSLPSFPLFQESLYEATVNVATNCLC